MLRSMLFGNTFNWSTLRLRCISPFPKKYVGYCRIAHSGNHSITHITIFIMVLKSYSLVSY